MPGIFFTTPLIKTASNGSSWTHVDAYFNETQVFANVLLSAYRYQLPERFMSFQPSWAEAYIVTPQTPMSGGRSPSRPSGTTRSSSPRTASPSGCRSTTAAAAIYRPAPPRSASSTTTHPRPPSTSPRRTRLRTVGDLLRLIQCPVQAA